MRTFSVLSLIIITTALVSFAGMEKLDGIVAVVGDEIILQSELDAYCLMRLNSLDVKPDSVNVPKIRKQFLEDLIDGKVLLVKAKGDTTISVTNDEVEKGLENHINMILEQNHMTMDSLERVLKQQNGMTIARFKMDTRRAIRDQLYKDKVQQGYLLGIKVSRRDVEDFYAQYKDSLPAAGESVRLSKLSLRLTPSDSVKQKAYDKIKSIYQKLNEGGSFDALAKKYSESPEGAAGGDLGFISKGSLSELVFEEKAFSLAPGTYSQPFESRLGFHIVKVVEKRDQMVHIQQIFIRVAPTDQQIRTLTDRLDSIRVHCTTEEGFAAAVRKFSADPVSKARDGVMGWSILLELPAEIRAVVDTCKTGQISAPLTQDNYMSIYRVNERVPNRKLTLENDWTLLEEKAKDIAAQKKLQSVANQWRKDTYIDNRL